LAPPGGYDVVIVGGGPAGIFSALELSRHQDLKVLILDKGKDVSKRTHSKESLLSGWGGAGAFSDGKLTFSTETGGWLKEYVGEEGLKHLLHYVDRLYLKYGAPSQLYGVDEDKIAEIARKAATVELKLVPSRIRHLGTEVCGQVLQRMREDLEGKVEIRMETTATRILVEGGRVAGVETANGDVFRADYVIVALGRAGADWLKQEAARLGLTVETNPVDIGVRVEVPKAVMDPLTDVLYEPKFIYYSKAYDDMVRTFCVAPGGYVVPEYLDDVVTVNGHSYANRRTDNTNFALLVSTRFTEPFKDPIAYGKYIAKLANLLVGGVMVQRLGDLLAGKRSTSARLARSIVTPTLTEAQPGDLSFVLPARYLDDIKEMLKALDKVAPGVWSKHTLLYGVEVKFYSQRYKLTPELESEIPGLYLIGDGAGITRGLVQSSASGIIAARSILKRKGLKALPELKAPLTR
jgi:hypothetical protein